MHIHILGICGTFMGGLALLARAMGHKVTGADANVYPPMSTQLEQQGIELIQGWDPSQLDSQPDLVVIGNAMSRGNPCVEAVLDRGLAYTSGPEFLSRHVLQGRWVLAVSGTHGKTTTASMLAWILEYAGYKPGYLIGGVPQNFGVSARLGESDFFVVEADEYDSAFFDKRSKFVHYRPKTLVINNLEFDHADIFDDLGAIQKQFHHLIRMVPSLGQIIYPQDCEAITQVLEMGCWSEQVAVGPAGWNVKAHNPSASQLGCYSGETLKAEFSWPMIGEHNANNALMAILAARHVGVEPQTSAEALAQFEPPKRRLELIGTPGNIAVYDDFAHHPTAITTTLAGLRAQVGSKRLIAVLEPRSATMKRGVHQQTLAASLKDADSALVYQPPGLSWDLSEAMADAPIPVQVCSDVDQLREAICAQAQPGDSVVIMSNGGFNGLHQSLLAQLETQHGPS
ncbi:UDP-N-acetylmuramate:L-alanyl-gamma-D-glutamyl-meso-diaminopimelate ligase [Paraferrimonas sedimenticola]|uniref:UDP-N-acetylmuramate--L-alanyl-gamma-D-glutamyl-meso-2,6-diaminoheptandioate ligase n=1 Tax=Paraferrimonas sedimenticola TaxID=375674 RepID=A0AA37RU90_9GAMM|nr:UDP-N-acetylmuramate:L-alanyl-gamma-D-glutamyl-meso-diaminopimelate ligase [Paraferrimonas sedimenticola]GLP95640.1 UDP-N-acetylmuramate--L-alanyl-gamma-D-glutamyl-meso-2,6-diaminoheptandioate ligase [Paraferrimonas sedimenticola]